MRQVTYILVGPAKEVFAKLRECKNIHGSFVRR